MNIRKLFSRIHQDAATQDFIQTNPDCPQSLREDIVQSQAGRPGFGPRDIRYNRSLELIELSL